MTDLEEVPTEHDQLRHWLSDRSYAEIRQAESAHIPLRPDGGTFRGIQLMHDVFLGRDCQFYQLVNHDDAKLTPISTEHVLHLMSFEDIRRSFNAVVVAADERRRRRA